MKIPQTNSIRMLSPCSFCIFFTLLLFSGCATGPEIIDGVYAPSGKGYRMATPANWSHYPDAWTHADDYGQIITWIEQQPAPILQRRPGNFEQLPPQKKIKQKPAVNMDIGFKREAEGQVFLVGSTSLAKLSQLLQSQENTAPNSDELIVNDYFQYLARIHSATPSMMHATSLSEWPRGQEVALRSSEGTKHIQVLFVRNGGLILTSLETRNGASSSRPEDGMRLARKLLENYLHPE